MGPFKSKEDDVQKVSTSIFVTNFPEYTRANDLWKVCKQYGNVVDAYIPNRRTIAGKRFGFVRFIKIFDVDRLVKNLCTLWIGNHRLHANVARFSRNSGRNSGNQAHHNGDATKRSNMPGHDNGKGVNVKSYASVVLGQCNVKDTAVSDPVLVLDDSCVNHEEFPLCLNGKVKEFGVLANLKVLLGNEGFNDIGLRYLGGLWIMIVFHSLEVKKRFKSCVGVGSWFSQIIPSSNDFVIDGRITWLDIEGVPLKVWNDNTFKRIAATKWGDIVYMENSDEGYLHSRRVCICTNMVSTIFESFRIMFKGKVYWVRAKETTSWVPDFA